MTNNPLYNEIRELAWRAKRSPADEARLRSLLQAHPEARPELEAEDCLTRALGAVPDVPVASNFTSCVLQAVEREAAARPARWPWARPWWPGKLGWLPKAAVAGLVLGTSLLAYHRVGLARQARLAQSVAAISDVALLPSPRILEDFDAIRALNQTPPADEELLALMQ